MVFLIKTTAGLADKQFAVQTLTLAVDQEFEGLQTADAEGITEFRLIFQQLFLVVLFHNFGLEFPALIMNIID